MTIKLLKPEDQENILKAVREKQHIPYRGKIIQITAGFSSETIETKIKQYNIFHELKEKRTVNPEVYIQ